MNDNVRVMRGISMVSLLAMAALLVRASPVTADVDVETVRVTDFMLAPPGSLFDPVPLEAPLQLGDLFTVLLEVTNYDIETHIVGCQYSYEISPPGSVMLYGEVVPWQFIYTLAPDESCWLSPICPAQWFEATEMGLVTMDVFGPGFGDDTIQFTIHPEPTTLAGDANLDGVVDGTDLTILGVNWQQSPRVWGEGNFDDNTIVDGIDLTILGVNWQWGVPEPPAEPASVPEPATLSLLFLASTAALWIRARERISNR